MTTLKYRGMCAVLLALLTPLPARATTDCNFATVGKTMTLQGDCTTDSPITVPGGFTLAGKNHTITAVDSPSGIFQGAVLTNSGGSIIVKDLGIGSNLSDACPFTDELTGIRLDHSTAKIMNVVFGLRRGQSSSTCGEGIGVDIRNSSPRGSALVNTTIQNSNFGFTNGNTIGVRNYGVRASGQVSVRVEKSYFNKAAHCGIELSSGAKGYVRQNQFFGQGFAIRLIRPAPRTKVEINTLVRSGVGLYVDGAMQITLQKNYGSFNQRGIQVEDVFGGIVGSTVQSNIFAQTSFEGIVIRGNGNRIATNAVRDSGEKDISDYGTDNVYSKNICFTSTGPPVDCGTQ